MQARGQLAVVSVAALGCITLLLLGGIIAGIVVGATQRAQLDLLPGNGGGGAQECNAFANVASSVLVDCEPVPQPTAGTCDAENRCVTTSLAAFGANANSFLDPEPIVCDSDEVAAACADAGGEGAECVCTPRVCVRVTASGDESLFTCDPLLDDAAQAPEVPAGFNCGFFTDVDILEQPLVLDCALRPIATGCDGVFGCSADVLAGNNQLEQSRSPTNVCGSGSNDECDAATPNACSCNEDIICVRTVLGVTRAFECTEGLG